MGSMTRNREETHANEDDWIENFVICRTPLAIYVMEFMLEKDDHK